MLMTRRSCILIGEAPNSTGTKDLLHLKLAARARDDVKSFNVLKKDYLIRLREQDPSIWEWARRTSHVNLLEDYPGPIFPVDRGRHEAERLWAMLTMSVPQGAVVLFAGQSVSKCFGYLREPWHQALLDGIRIMQVPHPSGLCRTWNDPEQRRLAQEKLRAMGDHLARASQAAQEASEPEGGRVHQLQARALRRPRIHDGGRSGEDERPEARAHDPQAAPELPRGPRAVERREPQVRRPVFRFLPRCRVRRRGHE